MLTVILRHRWLFLFAASLFAIVVMLGSHRIPLKYSATAMFEHRSDSATEGISRNKSESFSSIKPTLRHELAGARAVQQVVEDLGLTRALPHGADGQLTDAGRMRAQKLVRDLMKSIKVKWEVRSDQVDLVSVNVTHRDPWLAEHIPNALVKNYINWVSEQIVERLTASRDFLVKQVNDSQARVGEITRKKIEFETRHAGMLPDSPDELARCVQEVKSDIDSVRRQQIIARRKAAHVRALMESAVVPTESARESWRTLCLTPAETQSIVGLAGPAPESCPAIACTPISVRPTTKSAEPVEGRVCTLACAPVAIGSSRDAGRPLRVVKGPNPELRRLQDQLHEFKNKLEVALTLKCMTEKHPTVQTLRSKISQLRQHLQQTPAETVLQTLYDSGAMRRDAALQLAVSESDVQVISEELERLQQRLRSYQSLVADSGPVRQEHLEIIRALEEQQAEARRWQQRRTDVQMALAAELAKRRTHLDAVESAQRARRPLFPRLWMILGLAVIGGLAFGGGTALFADAVDRSVVTMEDAAQYFGVPVHGVIGEIATVHQRAVQRFKRWIVAPAISLIVLSVLGLSGLSVVLRLQYPEKHREWKILAPGGVYQKAVEPFKRQSAGL